MPNTRLRRYGNVEDKRQNLPPSVVSLTSLDSAGRAYPTEELLRAEREAKGPTVATIEKFIAAGKPVPNEIPVTLLKAAMEKVTRTIGKKIFLLNGFLALSPI